MNKKLLLLMVFFVLVSTKNAFSQTLVINEVVASNSLINTDEDGDYQDWVELFNNSTNPINLNAYGLTDDSGNLYKWVFPNVTINAGEYLIIYCSDKNRTNPANPLHTNFKISSGGEVITLTNNLGIIVDSSPAQSVLANFSLGRFPNGTGSFIELQTPTPNAENINGSLPVVLSEPVFSQNSGFFTSQFDLTISSNDTDATIIYTLDGSEPDENNLSGTTYTYKNQYPKMPGDAFGPFLNNTYQTLTYSTPISIVDRSSEPNKYSAISSTYDFAPTYFPNGPIFKGTVVKAKVIKTGATSSQIVTKTYFITPLASSRFTLPVVSISTNEDRFFEYNDGIYVAGKDFDQWRIDNPTEVPDYEIGNFARKGSTAERVANLSFFVNGNEVLNNNIGIRIRGNYSRVYPSKAFNIYSRAELGNSSLNYPLFPDQADTSYARISIKSSRK